VLTISLPSFELLDADVAVDLGVNHFCAASLDVLSRTPLRK
jgi:hypothetical protein